MTSITIPNSVVSVGEYAFLHTAWLNNQPNGTVYAGRVLYSCKGQLSANTEIVVKEGTTMILERAFFGEVGLISIRIPKSVTTIGSEAFNGCKTLKEIFLEDGENMLYIDEDESSSRVFYQCPLETLHLGRDVSYPKKLSGGVEFNYSPFESIIQLKYITISDSVKVLGPDLFRDCKGLTTISISKSIVEIKEKAFDGCNNLSRVNITDISKWCSIDFRNVKSNPLYYAKKLYLNGEKIDKLVLPDTLTKIKKYTFAGCDLKSIVVSSSVTEINGRVFANCSDLEEIIVDQNNIKYDSRHNCNAIIETESNTLVNGCKNTLIPNSVTFIGDGAFYECQALTDIEIPNSITKIDYAAFFGCVGLVNLSIPNSVVDIKQCAFEDCKSLENVIIEDGDSTLKIEYNRYNNSYSGSVGEGAFYDCPLKTLYLGRNVSSSYGRQHGYTAFANKTELTSLTIGNQVTKIEADAFHGCTNLTSVIFPQNLDEICSGAFYDCRLTGCITIPKSLTKIGAYAFSDCHFSEFHIDNLDSWCNVNLGDKYSNPSYSAKNVYVNGYKLKDLVIPDSITEIKPYAFYNCDSLLSVTITSGVLSIGNSAFYECEMLKTVINYSSHFSIEKGSWDNGDVGRYAETVINAPNGAIVGNFVFSSVDGKHSLVYYLGNGGEVVLPNNYKENSYTIGKDVFYENKTITSITIPACVESIGNNAFYGCTQLRRVINLSSLPIVSGSTDNGYVGYYAKDITTIPNGYIVGNFIFTTVEDENSLVKCTIPKRNIIYTFEDELLTSPINIWQEVEVKANDILAFDCIIGSVYSSMYIRIINTETYESKFDDYLYYNSSKFSYKFDEDGKYVVEVYSSDSNNKISNVHVYRPVELELVLPENYNGQSYAIADNVFNGYENLVSIKISNNVTNIGDYAFASCTNLKSVEISNSVTSIGDDAFYDCYSLTSVHIEDIAAWCKMSFFGSYANPLYYAKNLYLNGEKVTDLVIPNSVSSIGDYAFASCTNLKSVEIPNSVTSIGDDAFYDCYSLTSVHIEDIAAWCKISFSSAYSNPLYYADNFYLNGEKVTDLVIPNSVTSIGAYAFYNCYSLSSVEIPNSVTSIRSFAFSRCVNLIKLISYAEVPPVCGNAVFNGVKKDICVLQIPQSCLSAYQQADQWKEFFFIEDVLTAIGGVTVDGAVPATADVYSTNGMLIKRNAELKNLKHELPAGIYVIGGKKVYVK